MSSRTSDGVSASSTNVSLSKKVNKMLQNDIENDKDTLDALKGLSSIFKDNTLEERRNLRSNIERSSLNVNAEFLESFSKVKCLLDKLYEDFQEINGNCSMVCKQLDQTTLENKVMLEEARKLKDEAEVNEIKQTVVKLFLDNFNLSPDKVDLLRAPKHHSDFSSITIRTFESLHKINDIHEEAKLMLQNRCEQQEKAIELMELCALFHEAAFERIYKWTLNSLRTLNPEDIDLIQDAIAYLEQKPVLIEHCLDEYVTVRRSAFVRNFIDALTRGSNNKQPIDFIATDAVKYVNEILTWLHVNLANEKANLQVLFRKSESKFKENLDVTIRTSLSSITEGFSRPARYRIEQQLVHSQEAGAKPNKTTTSPQNLYKIKNLIQFYKLLLAEQLNQDCDLIASLYELQQLAERMFINGVNFHCASKLGKNAAGDQELINSDLSIPDSYASITALMRDLFNLYKNSPTRDTSMDDLNEILSVTLNPLIKWIKIWSSKMNSTEAAIFQLNCLNDLKKSLELVREQIQDHFHEVERQINEQVEILIKENSSYIVTHLGLSSLLSAINANCVQLANELGCDSISLKTASKNLDNFLASPTSVNLPQLDLLLATDIAENVRQQSLDVFCTNYEQIYTAINKPESNYDEETIDFFHHSATNVKTLLSS